MLGWPQAAWHLELVGDPNGETPPGASWKWDVDLPGVRRLYVDDPFGNRIELIDNGGQQQG